VALLAVEGAGRVLGLWQPSRGYRYSATRGYELRPNVGDVNRLGFRGGDTTLQKPDGITRIVVLGDSFTFGDGVTVGEAFPAQLERLLNNASARRYEVLNLGVPGYNTAQEVAYFRERGLSFDPDLVMIAFTLSDAEEGVLGLRVASRTLPIRMKEFIKAHLGLYNFVRLQIFKLIALRAKHDPAVAAWPAVLPLRRASRGETNAGWEQCRTALAEFAAKCADAHVPCMVVLWPVLEQLEDYPYRSEHRFLHEQVAAIGLPLVDLLPLFEGRNAERLWAKPTDPHPNAFAHEIAAHGLLRYLASCDARQEAQFPSLARHLRTRGVCENVEQRGR